MSFITSPLGTTKPIILRPYPFTIQTRTHISKRAHTHLRAPLIVAKFGFLNSGQVPDPGVIDSIKELLDRSDGFLYTLADSVVSSNVVDNVDSVKQPNGDWLSGITSYMETILKVLKDGLSVLHVPYSYGFAIILLTVLVKAATFPLSRKQVESAMAMRSLQPQIKAIQQRYAGDQEKIQLETARLYKLAGVNPFAGCLPTLATIPVWIGLYRALSNVANEGLLTEGFFWIPSLAGPTAIASRQTGSGISWLFPFVDGHPPLGWPDTAAYLVLPVLLIVTQYISIQIMQSSQPNDPSMKSSQALTKVLPLMIGYFSLSVPSGLSLYWLTNNLLSTAQNVWLQKLGGAKNPLGELNENMFKEDLSQKPQQNIFDTKLSQTETKSIQTETKPKQEEISPSTGLRPGDRFKQLKEEEEARKKRQREETLAKAVGAVTKDDISKQDNIVETPNGTASVPSGLIDARNGTDKACNSSSEIPVNGNVHDVTSHSQEKITDEINKDGVPINETSEQVSEEDPSKVAVEARDRLSSKILEEVENMAIYKWKRPAKRDDFHSDDR